MVNLKRFNSYYFGKNSNMVSVKDTYKFSTEINFPIYL